MEILEFLQITSVNFEMIKFEIFKVGVTVANKLACCVAISLTDHFVVGKANTQDLFLQSNGQALHGHLHRSNVRLKSWGKNVQIAFESHWTA